MTRPLVSVIVPAFNREAIVGDAVASVSRQTVTDLEIIVVDDGSADQTAEAAERAGDARLRVIRHSRNLGIPSARNSGLEAARGKYLAWLDSDDVARPDRLQRQVQFLESHADVALVGSSAGRIKANGRRKLGVRAPFRSHETLAASLLFRSPFQQSSITGRAVILKGYPYRDEFPVCEDLDMFIRISCRHRLANLPQALIDRRMHHEQIGRIQAALVKNRKRLLLSELVGRLGIDASGDDLDRHIRLGTPKKDPPSSELIRWAADWFAKLKAANKLSRQYDDQALSTVCARLWLTSCLAALHGRSTLPVGRALLTSSLTLGLINSDGLDWAASVLAGLAS